MTPEPDTATRNVQTSGAQKVRTSATTGDRDRNAERWFLDRGMPGVLTPRARCRHLVPRSAPALAAYATVYFLLGTSEIYIDGPPTPTERIVLAVIALAVPLAALVGWCVSRLDRPRAQFAVSVAAVAVAAVAGVIQGGSSHLLGTVIVVLVVLALTATGGGAVLAWAMRLTMSARRDGRAVRPRLAGGAVGGGGVLQHLRVADGRDDKPVSTLAHHAIPRRRHRRLPRLSDHRRVRPMSATDSVPHDDAPRLADTPFAAMPDPPANDALSRGERVNVILVLAAAQITHLGMVAISTAAIYFILGLVVLSPAVLTRWTGDGRSDGTVLGMTIPVPQSLIHMTLLLAALTFMYVSARSVTDDEFKSRFLDPLIEDLHATLVARNRYRGTRG
jgi:hypothetical protein